MKKDLTTSPKNGCLQKCPYVFLLFINAFSIGLVNGYKNGNHSKLGRKIEDMIENDLQVTKLETYLESLSFTFQATNGSLIIDEMTTKINTRLTESLSALHLLKYAAEEIMADSLNNDRLFTCKVCGRNSGASQQSFGCLTGWSNNQKEPMVPRDSVSDAMRRNVQKIPYINRQLIATEGVLVTAPSPKKYSQLYTQFRKAYISAVSPTGKDIVIVIDRSGSMATVHGNKTLLQITIEAVTKLLDTLNENDRIGIVVFDTGTVIPGASTRKCVGTKLVKATLENIRFYQNIIQQIQTGARCDYELALRDAFKFFKNTNYSKSGDKETRERVILFLTDGLPTLGGDPVTVIAEENKSLKNTVTVFTYAIGHGWNPNTLSILHNMARQTNTDQKYGKIKEGVFKHVDDPSQLDFAIGSFYTKLMERRDDLLVFPFRQYDTLRESYVSSIYLCKQLHSSNQSVFGATCLELFLQKLFGKQTLFEHDKNSYAFVIDGSGNTILHPYLPATSTVDHSNIPIETFEGGIHTARVLASMKRGESGHREVNIKRPGSGGSDPGDTFTTVTAYHWDPILHTNFSVCVVIVGVDGELFFNVTPLVTYNRYKSNTSSSTRGSRRACNHFNRYANKANSSVSFATTAHKDYDVYSRTGENDARMVTEQASSYPELIPSVLDSALITRFAERLWIVFDNRSSHLIWRYVGTHDGVLRIYPGIQVPKYYDHRKMPWFKRAVDAPAEIVLTGPYVDQWGGGYVITLSKAIVQTISTNKTYVFAVMAIDISLTYFHQLLVDAYPICLEKSTSCFVMDNRGDIVIHNDFVNISSKSPAVEGIHITQKSPIISKHLLKNGIMSPSFCLDIQNKMKRHLYWVSSMNPKGKINISDSFFQLLEVSSTNSFVVIEDRRYLNYQESCCNINSAIFDLEKQCDETDCSFLCHKDLSIDFCDDQPYLISEMPACTRRRTSRHMIEVQRDTDILVDLPRCFDPNCHGKSQRECHKTAGCSWCSLSNDLTLLPQAYCSLWDECYFGIQGNFPPGPNVKVVESKDNPGNQYGLSLFFLGGTVCGIGSLIISVLCIRLVVKRKRDNKNLKQIPANLPVRTDSLIPAENGYVVARVYPETRRQSTFLSSTQFGNVVYHHNFMFKNSP